MVQIALRAPLLRPASKWPYWIVPGRRRRCAVDKAIHPLSPALEHALAILSWGEIAEWLNFFFFYGSARAQGKVRSTQPVV